MCATQKHLCFEESFYLLKVHILIVYIPLFQPWRSGVPVLIISYSTALWNSKTTQEHYLIHALLLYYLGFSFLCCLLVCFSDPTWWLILPGRKRVSDQFSSTQLSFWIMEAHWVIVWVTTTKENIINGCNFFIMAFQFSFLVLG